MTGRTYPDEVAGPFPVPPATFTDRDDREIGIEPVDRDATESLVEMYEAFDPADRAQGIPPSRRPQIESWLEVLLEEGINIAAFDDEAVVGHATLVPDREEESSELAIFVLQSHQRAGIGKALIRHLLGYGAEQGIDRVWLTVERWNTPAVGLYRSVGFVTASAESFEMEMSLALTEDGLGD